MNSTEFVLLRGLTRNHDHWGELPHYLKKRFLGDVFTPDLPGAGKQNKATAPLTVKSTAKFIHDSFLAKIDKNNFGNNQSRILLGVSFGGMVAAHWFLKNPELFSKLVLINTSSVDLSPPWDRLLLSSQAKLITIFCTNSLKKREKLILELCSNYPEVQKKYIHEWIEASAQYPMKRMTMLRQVIAAATYKIKLNEVSDSVLILNSKSDRLVSSACSRKLIKKFSFKNYIHESGGHDLSLDDPEWVSDKIFEWFKLS